MLLLIVGAAGRDHRRDRAYVRPDLRESADGRRGASNRRRRSLAQDRGLTTAADADGHESQPRR